MNTAAPPERSRRGGLFARIFFTFVATALASAMIAGIAGFTFARRASTEWIEEARAALEESADDLHAATGDNDALAALAQEIGEQLDAPVGVYSAKGKRLLGDGPPMLPPRSWRRRARQAAGPVVLRRPGRTEPPGIVYALPDPETGRISSVVAVMPRRGFRLAIPLLSLCLMIPVLGVGAWTLSRSLTRRLARLETSANRIAYGDLQHRIELHRETPADELDQLGQAFNEMAEKVEALISGQRTLLANVSHELRTPIARMKVLVEILQERSATLRANEGPSRPIDRIDKGLGDLGIDIVEVETLISDLLTSGRLELRHGAANALQTHRVSVGDLVTRVASKVDARVEVTGTPELVADELLLERLLSNLLANGRRACPDGIITVKARADGEFVEFVVQDEGPGVAQEHRESIFEPFTRLDQARDRDRGGVGLGLYLSRQICQSHGGSIEVGDRPDGARGAHFVVRLPSAC